MSATLSPTAPSAYVAHSAPVAPSIEKGARLEVLDVLRGIALLGMYTVHFYDYSTSPSEPWRRVEQWFLDGRFYTMFAMLFGIGFAVQLSRADARGENLVPRYLRRLGALAVFGFIAEGIFGYNVLMGYAIWGLVLLPIRRWSTRSLFLLFLVCSVFRPLNNVTRMAVAESRGRVAERIADLKTAGAAFQRARVAHDSAGNSPRWSTVVRDRIRFIPIFHRQWSWNPGGSFLLMLAGFLAFRLGIFQDPARKRKTILLWMLAGATSFAVATWMLPWKGAPPMSLDALGQSATPTRDMAFTILSANGFMIPRDEWLAFVYMGIVLLLVAHDHVWLRRFAPFAWNGRMALTNYMTQVMFLDLTFAPYGLNLKVTPRWIVVGAVGLFSIQAVFSRWWLSRYEYGPLEWAWRSITYWRPAPMRRGILTNAALISPN
jgi:uncharacterized protein